MTITPKQRLAILERDRWACVSCGAHSDLTIHHRVNRGMGGSKTVDTPAHLLSMCNTCNVAFESSAEAAQRARTNGYKLQKNTNPPIDPTTVPVLYATEGFWYYLTDKTKRIKVNGK